MKPSTFVKYMIKFVGTANPITNFKFAEEYAKNNKWNKYLIFNYFSGISNPKFRLCKPHKIQLCCHCKTFQIFQLWGRLCEHSISHHIFRFCVGHTVNEQSVGQPMWPSQNLNMWWDILCSHNLPHNLKVLWWQHNWILGGLHSLNLGLDVPDT